MKVEADSLLTDLKRELANIVQVSVCQLGLQIAGKKITDENHPLRFYSIRDGSMVNLYMRSLGEKPVIYLYPEHEMDVTVKFIAKPDFVAVYPQFNEPCAWRVHATPSGQLTMGVSKRNFNSLFWEAMCF